MSRAQLIALDIVALFMGKSDIASGIVATKRDRKNVINLSDS